MKRLLAVAVLVVAVLSVWTLQPLSAESKPAAAGAAKPAQQWQYRVHYQKWGDAKEDQLAGNMEATFNRFAKEGFELFLMPRDDYYVFRRPVQQRIGDPLMKDVPAALR